MRMMSHQCQECSVHSSKPILYFIVTILAICTITGQYASVICNYNCMFVYLKASRLVFCVIYFYRYCGNL
jgi:hypothetical protein